MGYLLVVVKIGRVVVAAHAPVGFQTLLHHLMAHEADVEPMAGLVEILSHAQVLGHNVEPLVSSVFVCHNRVVKFIYGCKITNSFLNYGAL